MLEDTWWIMLCSKQDVYCICNQVLLCCSFFLQQYKCIVNSCLSRHFGSLNVCWLMWHFIVLDNYLPSKIYYIVFGFFSKVLVSYHGNEMMNFFFYKCRRLKAVQSKYLSNFSFVTIAYLLQSNKCFLIYIRIMILNEQDSFLR